MNVRVSAGAERTNQPLFAAEASALVRPLWRRLVLAAVLGALAAFAFAPHYWVPLIWVAFPGLALVLDQGRTPRQAGLTAGAFALSHFLVGIAWVGESFSRQSSVPEAAAPFAVAGLAALLALFYALVFGIGDRLCRRAPRWQRLVLYGLLWTGAEWLRGYLFTGFPWNPLAAIWTFSAVTMQPLAFLGTWGVGLVTAWAAFAPAAFLPPHRPSALSTGGLALAGLATLMTLGALRLPGEAQPVHPELTLRLVQPDIPQEKKWEQTLRGRHFARHLAMSETSADITGRYVVIWSESAVPYFLDRDPVRRRIVANMLPPGGVLLTGQMRFEFGDRAGDDAFYNAVVAIDDRGRMLDVYDKSHLVPFGEYIPLEKTVEAALEPVFGSFDVASLAGGRTSLAPGDGLRTMDVAGLPPFSPLVCYEGIFPGQVVGRGPAPQWLLNVTNDAWFGNSWGPYQHFALSRMRAVEEGLPLVRAANRGISAIIDPYGRIVGRTDLLTRTTLTGPLPRALSSRPLAGVLSPALSGGVLVLLLLVQVLIVRQRTHRFEW